MTIFNLGTDEGESFKYQNSYVDEKTGEVVWEDPEKDAFALWVRLPDKKTEEFAERRKRRVEHVLNPKTRRMERQEYLEAPDLETQKKETEELWDWVLAKWDEKNIDESTGKMIPITPENKIKLMSIIPFDRFVGKCIRTIRDGKSRKVKALEKNS